MHFCFFLISAFIFILVHIIFHTRLYFSEAVRKVYYILKKDAVDVINTIQYYLLFCCDYFANLIAFKFQYTNFHLLKIMILTIYTFIISLKLAYCLFQKYFQPYCVLKYHVKNSVDSMDGISDIVLTVSHRKTIA